MKFKNFIAMSAAALMLLSLGSCASSRKIPYFQDLKHGAEVNVTAPQAITLQPNDKISIIVSTSDPRLNTLFNLPVASNRLGSSSNTGSSESGNVASYTINKDGSINFPVLGKLHVAGLTREELAEYVRRELISRELAKDPIVTVDYMNLSVSVLGEVSSPGRIMIPREDFTILEAISMAGDLTITGKRDKVMVLRENNGKQTVYVVDLNKGRELTQSPVYYLQQNDVIYVEPNATKSHMSEPNGNLWSSPTFWISIASFLSTIGVLIFK